MPARWPHQIAAVSRTLAAIEDGQRRIAVTICTGGGKTNVAFDLADHYLSTGRKVSLYTNRKLLIEQITKNLDKAGFAGQYGVRAAGHQDERDLPMQISSFATEEARVYKSKRWPLHAADLAIIDEAHLNTGGVAQKIGREHVDAGCAVVGLTATPVGMREMYDVLLQCGTTSELRACGALVAARHYGCDEPDLKQIGQVALAKLAAGEDLTEAEQGKAIMVPRVFARVCEHYRRLNPTGRPTILFAPGVRESIGFAEEFTKRGIRAAHIDGDEIWIDGELHPSSPGARAEILELSRTGEIKVLCNRFVLREGIDCPWLSHGIFACIFGSLKSYLQSGGRLLRASTATGKTEATIQDHGGNWHRHGSLNADRHWDLAYTDRICANLHFEEMTAPTTPKPFVCPSCTLTMIFRDVVDGRTVSCPWCGHVIDLRKRSRPVVQSDGTLTEHYGDVLKPRVTRRNDDTQKLWERMYWRAKKSKNGMTFNAARGLFCHENGYYPPPDLKLMPTDNIGWCLEVRSVPKEKLRC